MTDKEIIKAKKLIKKLEEAYNFYYDVSRSMPYDIDQTIRETAICLEHSINEINHQKADIERLQADGETLAISLLNAKKEIGRLEKTLTEQFDSYEGIRNKARAEAITKFSERLKGDNFKVPVDAFTSAYVLGDDDIDQIAKELKGGGADA